MLSAWTDASIWAGVLASGTLATPLCVLLQRSRIAGGRPAAAIVAGLLAGLILGPRVLGFAQPDLHHDLLLGSLTQQHALNERLAEQAIERQALETIGVSPEAVLELDQQHHAELAPLRDARDAAQRERARDVLLPITALIAGLSLLAGLGSARGRTLADEPPAPGAIGGVLGFAFTALGIGALGAWIVGLPRGDAIALGAAAAGGSLLPGVATRWIPSLGRGACTGVAQAACLGASAAAIAWAAPETRPWVALLAGAALTGMVLRAVAPAPGGSTRRALSRFARSALLTVALPTLVALAFARIDPAATLTEGWRVAIFILLLIFLTGDGAHIGITLGYKVFGSAAQQHQAGLRAYEGVVGAGTGSAALAAVLLATNTLDPGVRTDAALLTAILLSAGALELLAPASRHAIRHISP